jgi:hypothetical protein
MASKAAFEPQASYARNAWPSERRYWLTILESGRPRRRACHVLKAWSLLSGANRGSEDLTRTQARTRAGGRVDSRCKHRCVTPLVWGCHVTNFRGGKRPPNPVNLRSGRACITRWGRTGAFPAGARRVNPRWGTPARAILYQAIPLLFVGVSG